LLRDRGSAIIIENKKVALIKRVRDGVTYYVFPGGGIEDGETPKAATEREAYEELGVSINVKECFDIVQYNGTQYFYIANIVAGTFGTGIGEEYQDTKRDRGTYCPVWMDIKDVMDHDIRPSQVAEKIYLNEKNSI
jgi:8-oxo-dGTP diphosphatase